MATDLSPSRRALDDPACQAFFYLRSAARLAVRQDRVTGAAA